jgi:hypothetical protein
VWEPCEKNPLGGGSFGGFNFFTRRNCLSQVLPGKILVKGGCEKHVTSLTEQVLIWDIILFV